MILVIITDDIGILEGQFQTVEQAAEFVRMQKARKGEGLEVQVERAE